MFNALFTLIDLIIAKNIASMVGVFAATITPLLGACVILYALYLAYQSLYEPQNLIIMESMKFIGSLSVVTFIALNTSWYLDNIVPIILSSGDQIAQALLGTSGGGGASLQSMFDTMMTMMNQMIDSIDFKFTSGKSWTNAILVWLQVVLIILGFIPFLVVSTAYLLVAKLMVSFLLILGPLFIMMSFFPSTRSFFQAWTGQAFNYTLLSIMYPLAFTVFIQVLDKTVFAGNLSLSMLFMTVIIFGALVLISVQIPAFCSTLSGGIGINGLVGGMLSGMGAIKSIFSKKQKSNNNDDSGSNKGIANFVKNFRKGQIKPG